MKRVSVVMSCNSTWGGTFQYALSVLQVLAEKARAKEIHVTILSEFPEWKTIGQEEGVLDFVPMSRPSFLMRAVFKVWEQIGLPIPLWKKITPFFHPQVRQILATYPDLCIFPAQDKFSIFGTYPSAVAIHDLMHRYEKFPEIREGGEFCRRELLFSNLSRHADKILVDSEVGKQHVMECYGADLAEKIIVLPYVAPKHLETVKPDFQILAKHGIQQPFFFYPAQFWLHKNHSNLIRAFSIARKQFSDIQLVLSGGEKNADQMIQQMISELNLESVIKRIGYINDRELVAIYQRATALVMPTFFGPTNIPPLEAELFQLPVIYSKIYAYQEFLGNGARFVDPRSPEDIAAGMLDVLNKRFVAPPSRANERRERFRATIERLLNSF